MSNNGGEASGTMPGEFDTRHMVKRLLELGVFLGVLVIAILSFPVLTRCGIALPRPTSRCSSSSAC